MGEKTDGKPDPGWNDPPLFSYDKATAIQASASKKGVSLTKRVAYPLSAKPVNASAAASQSPLLPQMKPPPAASDKSSQESPVTSEEDEYKNLSKTEKLDKVLKNLELLTAENDEDISKRIKIMEKMWMDDKLDVKVQLKLICLTEALVKGDTDLADHLQIGLMVDYISQCSSWMSGIRQLINYKRNTK